MMEFLKNYWYFIAGGVALIIGLVLLILLIKSNNKQTDSINNDIENTNDINKINGNTVSETQPTESPIIENNNPNEPTQIETNDNKPKTRAQKYIISYDKEEREWIVKKTGSTRASKRCKTKKEALEVAERLSEKHDLSLSVKKKDGKFQKQ